MKKLSIIVPTYNRSSCLKDCIKSIIISAKNFQDRVELVVSDDCSTDDTESVVRSLMQNNSSLKYIKNKKNLYTDIHFTNIIENSSSEYFWMIGDDDKITPNAIKVVLNELDKGRNLIYCNYSVWTKDFKHLVNPNGFEVREDIVFNDHNHLLEEIAFSMGYLSSVIGLKQHFLNISVVERSVFNGFTMPQVFPLYVGQINDCKALLLKQTLIMNRSNNNSESRWNHIFINGSHTIFNALEKKGFSRKSVTRAHYKVLLNYVIPHIVELKMHKLVESGLLSYLFKFYKTYHLFYIVCVPILLVPLPLLNIFREKVRNIPSVLKKYYL